MEEEFKDILDDIARDYQGLSQREYLVVLSRIMFGHDFQLSQKWIEARLPDGEKMSRASYYTISKRLNDEATSRLYKIAKEFPILISDELTKMMSIEQELYIQYSRESKPTDAAKILMNIVAIQPYITSLFTEVRALIQNNVIKQLQADQVVRQLEQRDSTENDRSTEFS